MLDISSQIFYTKATNLMSGAGKALINIIYECCLIQLQRPRNQNKQIFEGFSGTKRQRPSEKGARSFYMRSPPPAPFPKRRSEEQLGCCFLRAPVARPGFSPERRERPRPGEAEINQARGPQRPGAPCGDPRPCSASGAEPQPGWGPDLQLQSTHIAWDCAKRPPPIPVRFLGVYVYGYF